MSDTLVLLPGDVPHWLRITDRAITARGQGMAAHDPDDHVVAVVPAQDVTVGHVALPDLSEPQAQAAARLMMADKSASALDRLHVAVGKADRAGDRPIVAMDRATLAVFLADMATQGHDPDAVIAAPMLLARPEAGFVRGDFGNDVILRGPDSAFADDPVLTPLLTGGNVTTLDRKTLEQGLVDAVANPEVDLRQGIFAKRRAWGVDWIRLRRMGWLALAIAVASLLFHVVQLVRLNGAADRTEANNMVAARAALPPGTTVNNPVLQVQEQLNSLRGPGGGMLPLAAAVASAVSATPNLELTSLIFDGGGTLRITARAPTPTDQMVFEAKLKEFGLTPASGPTMVDQGQQIRDYTVSTK
jgi:general secretion pathway protein L